MEADKEVMVLDDSDLVNVNFDMMDDFISMMWPSNSTNADSSFNEWLTSNDGTQTGKEEEAMRDISFSNVSIIDTIGEELISGTEQYDSQQQYGSIEEQEYLSSGDQQYSNSGDQQYSSPGKQEYGSPKELEYGSPGEQEYGSPGDEQYRSLKEQHYDSLKKQQYHSPNEQENGSLKEQEYGSTKEQEYGSTKEQQYGSTKEQQYGSTKEQENGSPGEQQYGSPGNQHFHSPKKQQYSSPKEQQYGSPGEQQYRSLKEQHYDSPKKQHYVSPKKQQYDTPKKQHYGSRGEQQYVSPGELHYHSPKEQHYDSTKEQHYSSPKEQQCDTPKKQHYGSPGEQRYGSPGEQYEYGSPNKNTSPQQTVSDDGTAYLHKVKSRTYGSNKDYNIRHDKSEGRLNQGYYREYNQAGTKGHKPCGAVKGQLKRVRCENNKAGTNETPGSRDIRPRDIILKAEIVGSCNEKIYRQLKVSKKGPILTQKNSPELKHIAIINNNQALLTTLKKKPVQATKPIPKPTLTTLAAAEDPSKRQELSEEELPEKKTNHNAVERKYRYSINDKIEELKVMLMPPDTKIQKSGVLRKAIESIQYLQTTNQKLKFDNIQLKKKQVILEKNNHLLTLKISEQNTTSVVYLEKTPDLIEPQRSYQQYSDYTDHTARDTYTIYNNSENYKSSLPDSPESISDSEREMRHVRNSSGGSDDRDTCDRYKKRRTENRTQRTLPVMCMLFCLGMFVPGLMPNNTLTSTKIGRTLLAYTTDCEPYFVNICSLILVLLLVSFTISLLIIISLKTTTKNKKIDELLQTTTFHIENGRYIAAQRLLEDSAESLGIIIYPGYGALIRYILLYIISMSPLHTIARWLVRAENDTFADLLCHLSQMQLLQKHYKRHDWWTVWCYCLQALNMTHQSRDLYLIMSLSANTSIVKKYFFWQCSRGSERWLKNARSLVLNNNIVFKPDITVYHTVALELARSNLSQAAEWLILSDKSIDMRRIECEGLLEANVVLSSVFSCVCPKEHKELKWLTNVLKIKSSNKSLKSNNDSLVTQAISSALQIYSAWLDIGKREIEEVNWLKEEIQPALSLFNRATGSTAYQKDVLCVALDWVVQVQIGMWQRSDTNKQDKKAYFLLTQSLRVMESLVGSRAAYKLSLYNAVCRIMIGASPIKTRHLLEPLLPTSAILNYEQAAAVALCMKHLPAHMSSDNFPALINVFASAK